MADDRTDILHREPMRTLIEHLDTLATRLYQRAGQHGITRISVTPSLGLALGVAPGTSVDLATPTGRVEVYVERTPRSEGAFGPVGRRIGEAFKADIERLASSRIDPATVAVHQRGAVLAAAGAMLGGIVQATVEGPQDPDADEEPQ